MLLTSAIKGLLGIIFAVVLFNAGINYTFDFYGVFNTHIIEKPALKYNQRANKIMYLDTLPKDTFNAYILGSSRMGMISAQTISERSSQYHQTEHRFYNLNVFSGQVKDHVLFIEYLLAEGRQIDALLIGLDMYPFFFSTNYHQPQFRHHPKVSGQDRGFYLSYLFENSVSYLFTDFDVLFGTQDPKYQHDVTDGSYQPLHVLKSLADDPDKHWANERIKNEAIANNLNRINKTILPNQYRDLQQLMRILDTHAIQSRFFITPQHPQIQSFYQAEDYQAFYSMLSELNVPLVQIDLAQSFDADKYYYDAMHFNHELGKIIANKLYEQPSQVALNRH